MKIGFAQINPTVGDLRGHKRIVLSGLVVFGAGSLACGLAPTAAVLVVARVVQGVGAAARRGRCCW